MLSFSNIFANIAFALGLYNFSLSWEVLDYFISFICFFAKKL